MTIRRFFPGCGEFGPGRGYLHIAGALQGPGFPCASKPRESDNLVHPTHIRRLTIRLPSTLHIFGMLRGRMQKQASL